MRLAGQGGRRGVQLWLFFFPKEANLDRRGRSPEGRKQICVIGRSLKIEGVIMANSTIGLVTSTGTTWEPNTRT
jgi:hypothetical protein